MSATIWSKWFWSDWEADEALKMCSPAAQALWMRMLCICARSAGYLQMADQPLTAADIACHTGWPLCDIQTWLSELQKWRVFSTDRRGCIYSRRMVREEIKRRRARENGKLGGNPSLRKQNGFHALDNQKPTKAPTDRPTPNGRTPEAIEERGSNLGLSGTAEFGSKAEGQSEKYILIPASAVPLAEAYNGEYD